jgi:CBS domain-containing protein
MSQAAIALNAVLANHKASELSSGKGIIELSSKVAPIEAARVLWANNILGVPVWDETAKKYIGFFDMRDILSCVIAAAKADKDDKFQTYMVKELSKLGITKSNDNLMEDTPDDMTVSYLAARNPFVSCKPDATLADLCAALTEQQHLHNIPIVDDSGKCLYLVSQSALIKFLSEKTPQGELQGTLDEAGLPYRRDVVSIVDSADASDAFTLLDSKRLSGIAVVDEDGVLVGNTSARDIKFAALDEGRTAMDMDILSYLATVRQATPAKKERYPSCHVHEDSTVAHVINLLAKTGYHRVFVVDKDVKPVGVVSVSDVVKFAIQAGKK